MPLIDEPGRRLVAAHDPQWVIGAALAGAVAYLGGNDRRALELSEPIVPLFALPVKVFPRLADPPVAVALLAAHRCGDVTAFDRWATLARTTRSDDWMALAAPVAEALADTDDGRAAVAIITAVQRFSGEAIAAAGIALLREFAADLFATAGDRERAASAIAPLVRWLRLGDGRWYLQRIETWAAKNDVAMPAS